MNYQRIYDEIINNAKRRGSDRRKLNYYTERHHIIPKCLGGSNNKENIVLLTGREHYLCHKILFKLNISNHKLGCAWVMMQRVSNCDNKNSKTFNMLREAFSKICSKRMLKYFENPNNEKELKRVEKIKAFQNEYKNRKDIKLKIRNKMLEIHSNRSKEERFEVGRNISKSKKKNWLKKSKEYKENYINKCINAWNNRSSKHVMIDNIEFTRIGFAYKYVIENNLYNKPLYTFKRYISSNKNTSWHYI